jgi:hypothetical protein
MRQISFERYFSRQLAGSQQNKVNPALELRQNNCGEYARKPWSFQRRGKKEFENLAGFRAAFFSELQWPYERATAGPKNSGSALAFGGCGFLSVVIGRLITLAPS